MPKHREKTSVKAGLPPGTLVPLGAKKPEKTKIAVIDYDEKHFQEKTVESVEECFPFKEKPTVTWINVDGIHEVEIVEALGRHFNLHPLVLEDILHAEQRPKYEEFDDYVYIVFKMLMFAGEKNEVEAEQLSLIFGANFVLSFQEKEGDVFNPIRERIKEAKGRIRKMGADYLAYALLDAVVDSYFSILEKLGEKIEGVEEKLLASPDPGTLKTIHGLKGNTVFLRRSLWPLRELVSRFERTETFLVKKATRVYLRDVYDHTIQVIDSIETFRDVITGMFDLYLSTVSNRMNEVMKVLTIIATIFIPVTFIAGIYGMNFNPEISPWNMPELNWRWGYLCAWGIMVLVALSMLVYFRRKKWI